MCNCAIHYTSFVNSKDHFVSQASCSSTFDARVQVRVVSYRTAQMKRPVSSRAVHLGEINTILYSAFHPFVCFKMYVCVCVYLCVLKNYSMHCHTHTHRNEEPDSPHVQQPELGATVHIKEV